MKTFYVKDLEKGLVLTNETFAVKMAESALTKDGKTYYKLILIDKTGEIKGQIWPDRMVNVEKGSLTPGKVVMISGTVEEYRGALQLNVFTMAHVDESKLDEYMEASDFDLNELWAELQKYIDSIKTPELHTFLTNVFADKEISSRFKVYPAAEYVHHSFQGGLLEHTLEMLDLAQPLRKYYPEANFDLINTGIIMHDIGKIYELEPAGVVVQRTIEGYLLGHMMKSYEVALKFGKDVLSDELLLLLKHIILSHHGTKEYGSPVIPATIEANIVYHVDMLSSWTRIFQKSIRKAAGSENLFTEWDKIIGGKIYLGSPEVPGDEL